MNSMPTIPTSPPATVTVKPCAGGGQAETSPEDRTPTRKSMDLDGAMKHFARTSSRCCDKARSGRDPWVNGGALDD